VFEESLYTARYNYFQEYCISKGYTINQVPDLWYYRKKLLRKSDIEYFKEPQLKIQLAYLYSSRTLEEVLEYTSRTLLFKPHIKLQEIYIDSHKINFQQSYNSRHFFPQTSADNQSYLETMFGIPSDANFDTSAIINYLANRNICLIGGGESINNLQEVLPQTKFYNIDPNIEKISEARNLIEKNFLNIEIDDLPQDTEIFEFWASYSLPYYCQSVQDIQKFFSQCNMLMERFACNIRISPITFAISDEHMFDQMKAEFLEQIKYMYNSGVKIFVFDRSIILAR
jgi:hypothetical protein